MDKQSVEEVYDEDATMKIITPLEPDHYKLAEKVKNYNPSLGLGRATILIAQFLADQFQGEDPNFDRDAWLRACGL